MRCLHCGNTLSAFKKLTDGDFCSTEHRGKFYTEQQRLIIERLKHSAARFHRLRRGGSGEVARVVERNRLRRSRRSFLQFRKGGTSRMPAIYSTGRILILLPWIRLNVGGPSSPGHTFRPEYPICLGRDTIPAFFPAILRTRRGRERTVSPVPVRLPLRQAFRWISRLTPPIRTKCIPVSDERSW